MKFTSIAIDDELYALKDLEQILNSLDHLELKSSFDNAWKAVDYLVRNGRVNVVFCDIEMPNVSGIEAGRLLTELCDVLVFTTAHDQYTKEAYEVGAKAYFNKPVDREEVKRFLDKLMQLRLQNTKPETDSKRIVVKDEMAKEINMIDLNDIFCISSYGNYVNIETENGLTLSHNTMNQAEEKFCKDGRFIRISRTIIIAADKIKSVRLNKVILNNGEEYGIGRTFRTSFFDSFYRENHF